jgi:hypothetical protein
VRKYLRGGRRLELEESRGRAAAVKGEATVVAVTETKEGEQRRR